MRCSTHPCRSAGGAFALCVLLAFILAGGQPVLPEATRIVFLHHSCGANLIEQGRVREGLSRLGYEFYDHGYNDDGLRLADGSWAGTHFNVPGDNTDPDGFAAIFAQPLHDPPDNTFSHLMQYDVIVFKSCFPVSNIVSDEQLAEYRSHYLSIRDRIDEHPDRIFVVVTQPPEVPANSDAAAAARARAFTRWLQSDDYLAGRPNLFVFDFFGLLAGGDDFLRPEYRLDEYDAHPNGRANSEIGPLFVAFIDQAIRGYETSGPRPTAAALPPSEGEISQPTRAAPLLPAAGAIDDFESADGTWDVNVDDAGSAIECSVDTATAHGGTYSLRFRYNIVADGWGGCGRAFESAEDWSDGTGVSLWLHSDEEGHRLTLELFAGDLEAPTPFAVQFATTAESTAGWAQFAFSWTDFARAEWADEGGLVELDPTRVTGYGFSPRGPGESTLWVDSVTLAGGEAPPRAADATPVAPAGEEAESEEPAGGLCPLSAIALPLSATAALLVRRKR